MHALGYLGWLESFLFGYFWLPKATNTFINYMPMSEHGPPLNLFFNKNVIITSHYTAQSEGGVIELIRT